MPNVLYMPGRAGCAPAGATPCKPAAGPLRQFLIGLGRLLVACFVDPIMTDMSGGKGRRLDARLMRDVGIEPETNLPQELPPFRHDRI